MNDHKVFVGNVPPTSFTDKDLIKFFQKFGPITDAFVLRDPITNIGKRCAIITFRDKESAANLRRLHMRNTALRLKGERYFRISEVTNRRSEVVRSNVKSLAAYKGKTQILLHDESKSSTTIDDLNDDCLLAIFSFFSMGYTINFERVCVRWHNLLRKRWKSVISLPLSDFDFAYSSSLLSSSKLIKLLSRTENLKELNLTGTSNIMNYNFLSWISRLCPNLEQLSIDNGHVGKRSAKEFARNVKGLKVLSLGANVYMSECSLSRILKHSKDLESLEIVGEMMNFSGYCFDQVTPNLKSVSLFNMSCLTNLNHLFERASNLEEIVIENCCRAEPNFTSKLNNFEKVRKFMYRGSYGNLMYYFHKDFTPIGRLKNLVEVDLSFNISVSKNFLDELVVNSPNVTSLNLMCCQGQPFINDESAKQMINFTKLVNLNLSYTCALTDIGLHHLSRISTLKTLELVGIAYNKITASGAISLVDRLADLTKLDLSGNDSIDADFLNSMELLGLVRQTPIEINLGKTGIYFEDFLNPPRYGNIRITVDKTCNRKFRYDRMDFIVTGGFMPDPELEESEIESDDDEEEEDDDNVERHYNLIPFITW